MIPSKKLEALLKVLVEQRNRLHHAHLYPGYSQDRDVQSQGMDQPRPPAV